MQSPPLPYNLVFLKPKYLPQHPILKHSQLMFFLTYKKSGVTPIHNNSNTIHLYILVLVFFDSKLEGKRFCTDWEQAFFQFNMLISLWMQFWFVKVVPRYFNCLTNKPTQSKTTAKILVDSVCNNIQIVKINCVTQRHCRHPARTATSSKHLPKWLCKIPSALHLLCEFKCRLPWESPLGVCWKVWWNVFSFFITHEI